MRRNVSIVIPAYNEGTNIRQLVRFLKQWSRTQELIVVANGCTDDTATRARRAGARVIEIPEPLGHDVGRAIGIRYASGDIVLVLDADMFYEFQELAAFATAVERGVDIALNQYPLRTSPWYHHPTAVAKSAVNLFLDRPDLRAASLTAVPHALSRRAIQSVGWEQFNVPPVAQASAIIKGLRVEAVRHVPVGTRNPIRKRTGSASVQRLIIGDCLEAVHYILQQRGSRGGFPDSERQRTILERLQPNSRDSEEIQLSTLAVVPVRDEENTLPDVLRHIQKTVEAVCVVNNGSQDQSHHVAEKRGAMVEDFPHALGHDVGRAVACYIHRAQKYLFTDADIPIPKEHMQPFLDRLDDVDVTLNHLDILLPPRRQVDGCSIVKRFLNIALERSDLGVASMTAIPHGVRREVIEKIGAESLMVPPLAYVKALLSGFRVQAVHAVDVVSSNKYRSEAHSLRFGKRMEKLIIGDHLEALHYLLTRLGPRGPFVDEIRKRAHVHNIKEHIIPRKRHVSESSPTLTSPSDWHTKRRKSIWKTR